MKGLLTRFADGLLSKEQMKQVKGGYESGGDNCHSCQCGNGTGFSQRFESDAQFFGNIDSICGTSGATCTRVSCG